MSVEVNAWGGWGHLVVVRIAYDFLNANKAGQKIIDQVDAIL